MHQNKEIFPKFTHAIYLYFNVQRNYCSVIIMRLVVKLVITAKSFGSEIVRAARVYIRRFFLCHNITNLVDSKYNTPHATYYINSLKKKTLEIILFKFTYSHGDCVYLTNRLYACLAYKICLYTLPPPTAKKWFVAKTHHRRSG